MPAPEIGTVMADKTIYAGLSPQTGRMLFVLPEDESRLMDYQSALDGAGINNRTCHLGHSDWRLPTLSELHVIFINRRKGALRDTFNEEAANYPDLGLSHREAAGWYRTDYWSSYNSKQSQSFKDGTTAPIFDTDSASVRFIREGGFPDAVELAPHVMPDITATRQKRLKALASATRARIKFS